MGTRDGEWEGGSRGEYRVGSCVHIYHPFKLSRRSNDATDVCPLSVGGGGEGGRDASGFVLSSGGGGRTSVHL